MSLAFVHGRLAVTASWFLMVLGLWALWLRIRGRPLESSWLGAAVIAELMLLVQAFLGVYLYVGQGLGAALPRPFMHILYGIVAILTLPAAWGYFSNLPEEGVKSLAMAVTCLFLWGIVLRAASVAQYLPAGY